MALITAPENLAINSLVKGVIETLYTTDQFFSVLPFKGITGNALQYTRENIASEDALATVVGAGGTIAATQAEFTTHTASLTTIAGDAVVNGLTMATQSDWNNQMAVQIASKTKIVGRKYQNMLVNGTGAGNQFSGFSQFVADDTSGDMNIAGVGIGTAEIDVTGISFDMLDQLIDGVTDKGGMVDYLMMTSADMRAVNALLRGANGAGLAEVRNLPGGGAVPSYRGVPMFRNDFVTKDYGDLPKDAVTTGLTYKITNAGGVTDWSAVGGAASGAAIGDTFTATATSADLDTTLTASGALAVDIDNGIVFAGVVDDGSMTMGISGLTASKDAGISVENVGTSETKDEKITRVKWYCGLALFSERGFRYALHS